MKLKKLSKTEKNVPNFDTIENFPDDEIYSNGSEAFRVSFVVVKFLSFSIKDDKQHSPVQRNTANARERARMRVLSSAFYRLKTIIPWVPHDTKLSKLDTLRLARNYIAYLAATLDGQPVNETPNNIPHSQKMVSFIVSSKENDRRSLVMQPGGIPQLLTIFRFHFTSLSLSGS
jgi:hypothetical protein